MHKQMGFILFIFINLLFFHGAKANYTLYLTVGVRTGSGSTALNYIILTGDLGVSPKTSINIFVNGTVNPSLLTDGQLVIIENKFPDDYGFINKVTIGNNGDNLTIQTLNILDLMRNAWSNMTFFLNNDTISANSSSAYLFAVNGNWSNWSSWEKCSVSCGNGNKTRTRNCTNPSPVNGGVNCSGANIQFQSCSNNLCPFWTAWSNWSSCSASCGSGVIQRIRHCNESLSDGGSCPGLNVDVQVCPIIPPCSVNGSWSDWGAWSTCSVTCGSNGILTRYRTCSEPDPIGDGIFCSGSSVDTISCGSLIPPCPVWISWSSWTSCSTSCGMGTAKRYRNCSDATNGGINCIGLSTEVQVCQDNPPCPVNGAWSDWGAWASCSNSCGSNGKTTRIRRCTNPAPVGDGDPCIGFSSDSRNCSTFITDCLNGNSDSVTTDLLNSTTVNIQSAIDELTNKMAGQRQKMNLILKQLNIFNEWKRQVDSNLLEFECLTYRCEPRHTENANKFQGMLSYLLGIITNPDDKDEN